MRDTKPNLSDDRFEQFSGETLSLSGETQIFGRFEIESNGEITSQTGYKLNDVTILNSVGGNPNLLTLGNSTGDTKIIIGSNITPTARVHIVATGPTDGFRLVDGNEAEGNIFTSDADGVGTWRIPTGGTSVDAGNGIEKIGNTIILGGPLIKNTSIGGNFGLALGENGCAIGKSSFSQGYYNYAQNDYSHAEGAVTEALGDYSHAEGVATCAIGMGSHAEGQSTCAFGQSSHAEGNTTFACGSCSHAEGWLTCAIGNLSHAEGNRTCAFGIGSHSEGFNTCAFGLNSHAEGCYTIASGDSSHASGKYNVGCNNTIVEIGVGLSDINRCNAFEIDCTTGQVAIPQTPAKTGAETCVVFIDVDGGLSSGESVDIFGLSLATKTLIENTGNWTGVNYTGTAITDALTGQKHYNSIYVFEFVSDSTPIRWSRS